MTVVQLLAAQGAAVERVVFHHGAGDGVAPVREAVSVLEMMGEARETDAVVSALEGMEFEWGVSDGN